MPLDERRKNTLEADVVYTTLLLLLRISTNENVNSKEEITLPKY